MIATTCTQSEAELKEGVAGASHGLHRVDSPVELLREPVATSY